MHDYQQISNIVIEVKNGNQNAFASLFELFQSEFYFFAFKSVHEKGAAEDITQNAFIEIFHSIGKLDDPNSFVKWAYTILRRQCSKHFRKEKDVLLSEDGEGLFDTVESDHEEFLPGSVLETQETRDAIAQLIGELPEEQRSAILLHYYGRACEAYVLGSLSHIQFSNAKYIPRAHKSLCRPCRSGRGCASQGRHAISICGYWGSTSSRSPCARKQ